MIKSQVESIKVIIFHIKKSIETVQNWNKTKPPKYEYKLNILNNLFLNFRGNLIENISCDKETSDV